MAYKKESIQKMLKIANSYRTTLNDIDIEEIKMCISDGNRKIGKVINVSLMPVITCGNCKECKGFCYDIKACLQYPDTVINARMRNTVLLYRDRDRYFSIIENRIARRRTNKFFRWHVAGDIIDLDYFSRMVEIARRHSDFIFWTYTKMYAIVNAYCDKYGKNSIPENLHIMFSKWDGLKMDNPYNFPVFACRMKDGNKDEMNWSEMYKCPGNCDICKKLSRGCLAGENTFADEH